LKKLKVAIVGCGFVAQKRHIPGFLRLKNNVDVVALCDLNRNLAEEASRKFGVKNVYSSVEVMLSKEDLAVVDICTPPSAHLPVAVAAIEHSCNVLMEKPMALVVADCNQMIDCARKHNVKLSIVHNQRFCPPFIRAQKLVHDGVIGKINGMRIISLTNRREYMDHKDHWVHKLPGGVIGETGPHVVYMSLAFMDKVNDVNVFARKTIDNPWILFDDYRIILSGKINSSIYVSHAEKYTLSGVQIFGEEGAITINLESMLMTRSKLSELTPVSVALYSLNTAGQIVRGVISNVYRVAFSRPMLGHDIMIEKFAKSIIDDQPVPVSPEEGRETVAVMDAIVRKVKLSVTTKNAVNGKEL
jgi:predicted dehydrogenase